MSKVYKNITGSTEVEIVDIETIKISKFHLTNVHDTDSATVNLYFKNYKVTDSRLEVGENGDFNDLEKTTYTYYIMKNVVMPVGASISLDASYFSGINYYDYRLFIKLAAGTSAVDLIIYGNKSKDLYKKSQLKPYIIPQNNAGYGDD